MGTKLVIEKTRRRNLVKKCHKIVRVFNQFQLHKIQGSSLENEIKLSQTINLDDKSTFRGLLTSVENHLILNNRNQSDALLLFFEVSSSSYVL